MRRDESKDCPACFCKDCECECDTCKSFRYRNSELTQEMLDMLNIVAANSVSRHSVRLEDV